MQLFKKLALVISYVFILIGVLALLLLYEHKDVKMGCVSRQLKKMTPKGSRTSERRTTTSVDPYKKEVRFPDSIIIGEMKCGTSAMQFFQKFHPDIAMSKFEVNFFSIFYYKGWDWYKKRLPEATPSQIVMEKSLYFGSLLKQEAWRRIYEYNPNIKMILNLRDPVERTISHFNMKSKNDIYYFERKLEDFIYKKNNSQVIDNTNDFIYRGHYYTNMLRWIKYFPLQQILILDQRHLKQTQSVNLSKLKNI